MFVRFGLAVTAVGAAVTYRRQLHDNAVRREHEEQERKSRNEGADRHSTQQKTPAEEVKRVNPSSPATSVHEGSESNLLLPEFDDLLNSNDLGLQSPSSAKGGRSYGAEGVTDADLEKFRTVPRDGKDDARVRVSKGSGKRVGSRRSPSPGSRRSRSPGGRSADGASDTSDAFPDGPDYLLGEYVDNLADETAELHALRETVKVLKQKESRMEAELLDYYDLEDQEQELIKLEQELDAKDAQVAKLKERIGTLEARATKLSEEAASITGLKKDLEEARARSRELQKQINTRVGDDRAELLMLRQKVATLEEEKVDAHKRDLDTDQKLQSLRDMEVEIVELRRTNKDLQYQKRELNSQLDAAEDDIEYLQSRTDEDVLAEADADLASLRHTNEDLVRQVEGLQNDRFTEVEELVYLRWVNACLRYELRNYQAPDGHFSALNLNKDLSPRSQEKAKHLMLQYANPDVASGRSKDQLEGGYESTSSETSIPSEDSSDISSDMALGSGPLSRRNSLIKRLKSWTGRKDDGSISSGRLLSSKSLDTRAPKSRSKRSSKGPLEALLIRNSSDAHQITTYGAANDEVLSPGSASTARSASNLSSPGGQSFRSDPKSPGSVSKLAPIKTSTPAVDGLNSIAASFQVIAKSVPSEISAKYPAFKDRHKAAMEREQALKEAAQAEREKALAEKERAEVRNLPKVNWSEKLQQGDQEIPFESLPVLKRAEVISKPITAAEVARRELRKPNPPPKPSRPHPSPVAAPQQGGAPGVPPPPPPPPPRGSGVPPPPPPPPMAGLANLQSRNSDDVSRAPEVVEFYQSLMKRDARVAVAGGGVNPDAHNNMIGEIENRSSHLLAIKADVETQGEFVLSLAAEVRAAAFSDITDVVDFVGWLDDELSFLVDERAVLKHFDWPEGKADAIREAAFEYQDLMKLLSEVSKFEDKREVPCERALKKMLSMLEKVEQSVYGLLRTRDMAKARYREFGIPVQWMLDSGVVGKIKLASVKLARLYMKRISTELDLAGTINEPVREFLLLQGVRFAFRVHQFAGGFDPESMRAFEALRDCANRPATPSGPFIEEGDEEEEEEEDEDENEEAEQVAVTVEDQ